MSRYVYLFSELGDVVDRMDGEWDAVRNLLGGKGANLGEMTRLGIPVPPGFSVTTEACARFGGEDGLPTDIWAQELEAIAALEAQTEKGFGDPGRPLLVSCRSGAPVSMPGMMDTVLNIGLNDDIASAAVERGRDGRFVYDLYRRLVQMFGEVVLGVPAEVFEAVLSARRSERGVSSDTELGAEDWREITGVFKEIVRSYTGEDFPDDPREQLRLATEAVFRSWNGARAREYRRASGIPDSLGTAVNVQTMVYGNVGTGSATGICMSRNATTGEPELEGDYLRNAQGEDVVAGIRATRPLRELADDMPEIYRELEATAKALEAHYRNMQDMEFTVEEGTLWLLQTRDGKRTAQAEVRIASDMVSEGLITREEAVRRVRPNQIDIFMHPQFDPASLEEARPVASGLNVSPGAAVGMIALDADTAQRWAEDGRDVILVRPETKPDDVHGMLAAKGLLTSRGGRTSHAALVARQFGKPAVVGVAGMEIDFDARLVRFEDGTEVPEREWLSIDGTSGAVYEGHLDTLVPDLQDPHLLRVLSWADEFRDLEVRANADYPEDARRAREYGAQGIGLCRTEHMFFESERLPIVQRMIMAKSPSERDEAIAQLLPFQKTDFEGLFRVMDGLPVIVRLIDPPLHEFLPSYDELVDELADLKIRSQHARELAELDVLLSDIHEKQRYLSRVVELREQNPMLGTRGVRLGILVPGITRMQVRAIFEAACAVAKDGGRRASRGDDPARRSRRRAPTPTGSARGGSTGRHGRARSRDPLQVRHHDRGPAGRAHSRSDRRGRGVLLVRHERPHPDDVRDLPRRRRIGLPHRVSVPGHPPSQPLRHAGRRRRGTAHVARCGRWTPQTKRTRGRDLRRARGRPAEHRALSSAGLTLRVLLAVPGADRPAGGGPRRVGGGGRQPPHGRARTRRGGLELSGARHSSEVSRCDSSRVSPPCPDPGRGTGAGLRSPRPPEPVRFEAVQPELFGAGGALTDAWADIDGDGDPDRFVGFNGTRSRLYRNDRDQGFVDVASSLGLVVERSVRTAAWGDFDADGDPDLLLGYAGDAPVTALYRNDGPRGFMNVAGLMGLELEEGTTRQASWIDYDGDGDLDLFLALRDRANRLFRNGGSEGFVDVTEETGIGDPRRTVGALWLDADHDGDLDLLTANMNGDANGDWRNDQGRFIDIASGTAVESGGRALADESQGSVRVCAADVHADGVFDLFYANYGANALLRGTRPGAWEAPLASDALGPESRYDTCVWGDFDNDGTLDLYVNGTVGGGEHYRDYLFRRQGSEEFLDVTPAELLSLNASHGATWVDFDLDGDLDLALAGAAEDGMHHLMRNRLQEGYAWQSLAVRVLDAEGRATLPGSEVRIYSVDTGALLGTRLTDTGSGYDAQSDLPVHFGVPGGRPVTVEVTILTGGQRRTARIEDVDPATYQRTALEVRIDSEGRIQP